jgi:hypothetical protein
MLMQIVEGDDDDLAHVAQVGNLAPTTLCGKLPVTLGSILQFNEMLWPDRQWCESCRAAYRSDTQRHTQNPRSPTRPQSL